MDIIIPRLIHEPVPCFTANGDDFIVRTEDAVGQPIVSHELPYVFYGVELWCPRRQRHDRDVVRDSEFGLLPNPCFVLPPYFQLGIGGKFF